MPGNAQFMCLFNVYVLTTAHLRLSASAVDHAASGLSMQQRSTRTESMRLRSRCLGVLKRDVF